jgi:hypothetical protein
MHRNRRYVKLAWIGLLAGLAWPSPARAEIIAPSRGPALLAVAPDGSPRVAFLSGRELVLGRRAAPGWSFTRLGRVPGTRPVLAGLVVDGRGRSSVLVEQERGTWLALVRPGSKLRIVARPRRGASFGSAGLTLDRSGRPAFAYVLRLANAKTWLRLVALDARGRLHTHGITKGGFPASAQVPSAAPVLVGGRLHVVETFTSAAIDWHPKQGGGWEGQFLFASRDGTPAGRVGAVADGSDLWSSWTQVYGEAINVLLTLSTETQQTEIVVDHGIFVSLLLDGGRPEVGAYDWVELNDAFVYAGILADPTGPFTELDGRLLGYAAAPGGRRQLLLETGSGLEWFQAPSRPTIRVSLSADASGHLTGRVDGAGGGGGGVALYRETGTSRTPLGNAELAADGSFTFDDTAPTSPTLYRAVYVEPATDIPYASLVRVPLG